MPESENDTSKEEQVNSGWLGWIERVGNRLPDPATLFLIGTVLVMIASAVAVKSDWVVLERLPDHAAALGKAAPDGTPAEVEWKETGRTFEANNILTRDGLFWAISSMVENFINFAPLGIVLVGMLGIGIAERTGFIGCALKAMLMVVPQKLLTPAMVFLGIMSSMTSDAGYIILPPLAAALYKAVGRAPLAGLAAVFAGVAAGFNANLAITSLEPMLSELATKGAQVIDPSYEVNPACNWWFMIASTIVMTAAGWFVADVIVEKRLANKPPEEGGPSPVDDSDLEAQRLTPDDKRALKIAGIVFTLALATVITLVNIPGSPLYTYQIESPTKPGQMITVEVVEVAEGEASPEGAIEKGGQFFVPSKIYISALGESHRTVGADHLHYSRHRLRGGAEKNPQRPRRGQAAYRLHGRHGADCGHGVFRGTIRGAFQVLRPRQDAGHERRPVAWPGGVADLAVTCGVYCDDYVF